MVLFSLRYSLWRDSSAAKIVISVHFHLFVFVLFCCRFFGSFFSTVNIRVDSYHVEGGVRKIKLYIVLYNECCANVGAHTRERVYMCAYANSSRFAELYVCERTSHSLSLSTCIPSRVVLFIHRHRRDNFQGLRLVSHRLHRSFSHMHKNAHRNRVFKGKSNNNKRNERKNRQRNEGIKLLVSILFLSLLLLQCCVRVFFPFFWFQIDSRWFVCRSPLRALFFSVLSLFLRLLGGVVVAVAIVAV